MNDVLHVLLTALNESIVATVNPWVMCCLVGVFVFSCLLVYISLSVNVLFEFSIAVRRMDLSLFSSRGLNITKL